MPRQKKAEFPYFEGEASSQAKLNELTVIQIRRQLRKNRKLRVATLARKYGVSPQAISLAARGITWSYLNARAKPVTPALLGVAKGEQLPHARLTAKDVIELRKLFRKDPGRSIRGYAELYGVARDTLSRAIRGVTWKHLPGAVKRPHRKGGWGASGKRPR
jgi:transcriptional regulator with XRE-family HTH domain